MTLQVHIDGDRLEYERQGDRQRLRCEVVSVVFGKDGKIADQSAESITASLDDSHLAAARREGYRYTRRLKLKPGLYQVRVGVRDLVGGMTGTSASWIEVPDLRHGKLNLSSLFLGHGASDATSSSSARDDQDPLSRDSQSSRSREVARGHEGLINSEGARDHEASKGNEGARGGGGARRAAPKLAVGGASIKGGDSVFYRFVVYRAAGAQAGAGEATMKVEVVQGEKEFYSGDWQPLAARAVRSDAKGVEAGGQLRLTLPPGLYTLRVTVKDSASRKTVQRESDFEIGQ